MGDAAADVEAGLEFNHTEDDGNIVCRERNDEPAIDEVIRQEHGLGEHQAVDCTGRSARGYKRSNL